VIQWLTCFFHATSVHGKRQPKKLKREFEMKRFWHTCLAMIATATMTAGVANAQNNWNAPSEIGSYQSILSRAGYGQETNIATAARQAAGSGSVTMPNGGGAFNSGVLNQGMVNGGFNGDVVNGGMPFNGSPRSVPMNGAVDGGMSSSMGAPMTGQPVEMGNGMTQPRMTQQRMAQPMGGGCTSCSGGAAFGGQAMNAPMMSGGYVDSGYSAGNAYNGVVGNTMGCSGGPGPDPGYHPPIYGAPFRMGSTVGQIFNGGRRGQKANWVAGLYAMSFARDYEDDRLLSQNPSGDLLSTRSADEGDFGGYGVSLTRRACSGRGIELRYWAFNPDATAQLDGVSVATALPTLDQLQHVPTGRDLEEIYNSATNHVLVRNTDINNFEVNLLNNGGNYRTRRGRAASFELLGGFRWFQFDETLSYISNNPLLTAASPTQTTYQSFVENDLVGFQLGARNEICLNGRWRAFAGISTGIFNNRINSRQRFFDQNGSVPTLLSGASAGRDFDYSDQKDQVAILGEMDLGLTYQVNQRLRARFGYRTFGVAGVALAADQIPYDFTDTDRIQRANSNGSLLLHGGYFGLEACF
jgi:hypothetical protein